MHRTWLVSAVLAVAATGNAEPPEPTAPRAQEILASQPIRFEKNLGQTDEQALFLSRGRGHLVFLTRDGAVLSLRAPQASPARGRGDQARAGKVDVIRLRFLGANPEPVVEAEQPLGGPSHYLIGSDSPQWRTHVPNYARVEYREVYPGIGLAFYGTSERQLEYDFVLEPGADLSRIRIRVDGARRLRVDDEGHLHIETRHGVLVQKAPIVYQDIEDMRRLLPGRYVRLGKREVGFAVDGYDPRERLVVDPVLQWSTYLGGSVREDAQAVVADSAFVYVTGSVVSTDFPITGGALDSTVDGSGDAFVAKFPIGGGAPTYSTYLGGTGSDIGYGLAHDTTGAVVVVGQTSSPDFPRQAPAQGTFGGVVDAFVTKLNTAGLPIFSTYLGGPEIDEAWDVWASASSYVVGRTASSSGFPITSLAFQAAHGGSFDAFLTRFNSAGAVNFSTYLGGSGSDWALGISMDNSNPPGCDAGNPCPVLAGETSSTNFPTQTAMFPTFRGLVDGFVTKFNALPVTAPPATLAFSTYLGGTAVDQLRDVKVVNTSADVYVVGDSQSADFPLMNAYQTTRRGPSDAVVAGFNRTGSVLQFSTYLGGSDFEQGFGLGFNSGYISISGMTESTDFPVANPLQATFGGGINDAFLTRFVPQACAVSFSTFLGGTDSDIGYDVTPFGSHGLFAVGQAGPGFPTTAGAFQQAYRGGTSDAWVARIDATPMADLSMIKTDSPDPVMAGSDLFYTLTVRNNGPNGTYGVVVSDTLPPGTTFVDATPPVCGAVGQNVTCNLGCMDALVQTVVTLRVNVAGNPPTTTLSNTASVASSVTNDPPFNNSDNEDTVVTLNADVEVTKTANPSPAVLVGDQVVYTVTVHNNGPSHAANVVLTDPLPAGMSFVSSSPGGPTCMESGGIVTCNYGTVLATETKVLDITVQAATAGTWDNQATVSTTTLDLVSGNNSSSIVTTEVLPPPEALPVFAATSTGGPAAASGRNLLQWTNPTGGGPYTELRIRWNKSTTGTSNCVFPTGAAGSSDGVFNLPGPPWGGKGNHSHDSLELDTAYCYTAWTLEGPSSQFVGPPRTLKARPFDSTSGKVRWSYSTTAATLVPAGLSGSGIVGAVSNDQALHHMLRDGLNKGEWPGPYLPPAFGGPSQGRPAIAPTTVIAGSSRLSLVSTQDGVTHAVDTDTGAVRWDSTVLGTSLQGSVAAMFTAFGGAQNQIFVATWNPSGDNAFYALDAVTGAQVGAAFTNGGGANGFGISSGGAAVAYPAKVYFTTRRKNPLPGTANTLWCMDVTAGGLTLAWGLALGDIDVGPVLRNGRLYVASGNTIHSVDVNALPVPTYYSHSLPVGEDVKGFISADRDSMKVYFSTTTKVWGFDDTGTGFSQLWPEVTLPGGGNMPSVALFARGTPYIYVGGADGQLHQLDVTSADLATSPIRLAIPLVPSSVSTVVGDPALDTLATPRLVYVGTDEGVFYAVEVPLP